MNGNTKVMLIGKNDNVETIHSKLIESKKTHFEIIQKTNVIDSLKYLKENLIDVILVDLEYPYMENLKILHQLEFISDDIPILVLTDTYNEEFMTNTVELGAQGYLVKDELRNGMLFRSIFSALERKPIQRKCQSQNMSKLRELTHNLHKGPTENNNA